MFDQLKRRTRDKITSIELKELHLFIVRKHELVILAILKVLIKILETLTGKLDDNVTENTVPRYSSSLAMPSRRSMFESFEMMSARLVVDPPDSPVLHEGEIARIERLPRTHRSTPYPYPVPLSDVFGEIPQSVELTADRVSLSNLPGIGPVEQSESDLPSHYNNESGRTFPPEYNISERQIVMPDIRREMFGRVLPYTAKLLPYNVQMLSNLKRYVSERIKDAASFHETRQYKSLKDSLTISKAEEAAVKYINTFTIEELTRKYDEVMGLIIDKKQYHMIGLEEIIANVIIYKTTHRPDNEDISYSYLFKRSEEMKKISDKFSEILEEIHPTPQETTSQEKVLNIAIELVCTILSMDLSERDYSQEIKPEDKENKRVIRLEE